MSKRETPLTRKYWESIGGTLIEEFPAGSQSQWDGGFDEYQGEYVLIIKVNSLLASVFL